MEHLPSRQEREEITPVFVPIVRLNDRLFLRHCFVRLALLFPHRQPLPHLRQRCRAKAAHGQEFGVTAGNQILQRGDACPHQRVVGAGGQVQCVNGVGHM